jgi:hypothetical protein
MADGGLATSRDPARATLMTIGEALDLLGAMPLDQDWKMIKMSPTADKGPASRPMSWEIVT